MKNITLSEMQEIERNILQYIDEICQKNDIEYSVVGGTAIGAIRHNGFIPWDDDIDIGLTPKNYEKLIKCIKEDNNKRYQLLDYKSENTYQYPFAKVVDTKTTLVENNQNPINNYGVFVDIFKYFGMPNNKIHRFFFFYKLKKYNKYMCYAIYRTINANNCISRLVKRMIKRRAERIGLKRLLQEFEILTNKYPIETAEYCISNWPLAKRKNQNIKSTVFTNGIIRHKFDNIEINIMKEYEEYLTTGYGDYMQLPPEDKRIPPHPSNVFWKDKQEDMV